MLYKYCLSIYWKIIILYHSTSAISSNVTAVSLCICDLKTELCTERAMTAWKTCVARHPNLRNKIVDEKISHASTFSTPTFLTDQNIDELFTKISNEFVPLDREPAPNDLFLVRNGKTLYFIVRMLHSLTDGTSLNIIFNDFMKFYELRMTNVDSLQFLPQPLNYEDPDKNLRNHKGWFHLMFTICSNSYS